MELLVIKQHEVLTRKEQSTSQNLRWQTMTTLLEDEASKQWNSIKFNIANTDT